MSELQVKIDGEWKFLEKIEEVEINGEMLENWEKGRLFVCPDQAEAGYPAKANDNICPYYVPKKLVPRGQLKTGTSILLEWEEIKENENMEKVEKVEN